MKITIDIDSREAEAILFSLALRSKQRGISDNYTQAAVDVGERLNKVFEKSFAWDEFDRMNHMRKPIKSVSVKCYDFAPE